jgi:hypothetical protein
MKTPVTILSLMVALLAGAPSAGAGIIVYFDDLPLRTEGVWLTDGYQGFNWADWKYSTDLNQNNYAYSGTGGSVSITRADALHFDFDGAAFAVDNPLTTITVQGWSGDTLVGTEEYTGFSPDFTFQVSELKGIDRVVFTGSNPWRMDEFADCVRPVPEASTIFAGVMLLLPFAVSTVRILRRNRPA